MDQRMQNRRPALGHVRSRTLTMKTSLTSDASVSEGITPGQSTLITRMLADIATSKPVQAAIAKLSVSGAERLKGNPQFIASVRELVLKNIGELSVTDQFANEEVSSNYVYPKGYEIKDLADQVKILVKLFPGLDTKETLAFIENELPKLALPQGAEGWFAIPRRSKLGATYNEALDSVLAKIEKKRSNFRNYRKGETGPSYLRETPHSAAAWDKIESEQKGDILVVPLQLGLRHRGRSVRRAREIIMDNSSEFALGAFAVGCVALTHPDRFQRHDELDIDCSGDDYAPGGGGRFSGSLYFFVYDDGFKFDWGYLGSAYDLFGSASGFFPQ